MDLLRDRAARLVQAEAKGAGAGVGGIQGMALTTSKYKTIREAQGRAGRQLQAVLAALGELVGRVDRWTLGSGDRYRRIPADKHQRTHPSIEHAGRPSFTGGVHLAGSWAPPEPARR